jgi:hypothetical protein
MIPSSGISRLSAVSIALGAWAVVTLISAAQGQLFATYHGRQQDWWPTLGYTAAVFSVWALLAPAILKAVESIRTAALPRLTTATLLVLGYPITTTVHVMLFVGLFWPVYGAKATSPFAMIEPVLLANLDKSAFAYLALIAVAHFRWYRRERAATEKPAEATRADDEGLWIRVAGGTHLIRFPEIDWIAAAGDYAEVHAGDRRLLTDRSLATLTEELPEREFARIHRGAIVRLDRVREVRRLGRGDASILLHTGHALRLSRRYRDKLAAHLPL